MNVQGTGEGEVKKEQHSQAGGVLAEMQGKVDHSQEDSIAAWCLCSSSASTGSFLAADKIVTYFIICDICVCIFIIFAYL